MSGFIDTIGNFAMGAYDAMADLGSGMADTAIHTFDAIGHAGIEVGNFFGSTFDNMFGGAEAKASALSFLHQPHALSSLTADVKQTVLEDAGLPAAVVAIPSASSHWGLAHKGAVEFSFNGVNEGPSAMQPVADRYEGLGVARHAVLYDEVNYDLDAVSTIAASSIENILNHSPPGTGLILDAYSMGTRVAYGTLAKLEEHGALHRDTQVNMFASTTAGYDSANHMPAFLAGTFLNTSYLSMGSFGGFQSMLDEGAQHLANNHHLHFNFIDGLADTVAPGRHDGQPAGGIDLPRLLVDPSVLSIPDATHLDILQRAEDLQVPPLPSFLLR